MLHDVAIVGAGPVGATLALALAEGDLDVVVLDARARGETLRGDRSIALSHGARLVFDRLGVWDALSAVAGAMAPFPKMAGTASSLLGMMQLGTGALVGYAVGRLHDGTPVPMAATVALCSWALAASYWFIVRPARR